MITPNSSCIPAYLMLLDVPAVKEKMTDQERLGGFMNMPGSNDEMELFLLEQDDRRAPKILELFRERERLFCLPEDQLEVIDVVGRVSNRKLLNWWTDLLAGELIRYLRWLEHGKPDDKYPPIHIDMPDGDVYALEKEHHQGVATIKDKVKRMLNG